MKFVDKQSKGNVSFKVRRGKQQFSVGFRKSRIFSGGLPIVPHTTQTAYTQDHYIEKCLFMNIHHHCTPVPGDF